MEVFSLKNLTFKYNNASAPTLKDVTLDINEGELLLIIGESGCGKTTLLKMLKKELTPHGLREGEVIAFGSGIDALSDKVSAEKIGFIMQDPDAQIVTDKVYSELAFGLENLGFDRELIRARVSEFATYFGLNDMFERRCDELSGGQKQLLNLASVMAMSPEVIILDEPTAQLDPISAMDFITSVKRLNDDFGVTVIIAEHHLEKLLPIADHVACIEDGRLEFVGKPREICSKLSGKRIAETLPTPVRVFNSVSTEWNCPLTVKEGRDFLKKRDRVSLKCERSNKPKEPIIQAKDLWFRYEKHGKDVLKGLDLKIFKSELYAVVGANGCGKSTLLSLLNRTNKPYRGRVKTEKECAYLPQNPKNLFVKDTVGDDFKLINNSYKELCERFDIETLINSHPYDLSGGELQKAAIVKLLLTEPEIILLDEPTKGLDTFAKKTLGKLLRGLISDGKTVVLVTHDLEFAACYADRCGLLFDGVIAAENTSREFFALNSYYTTAAAAMSRGIIENAVTADDIIRSIGGECR